MHTTAAHWQAVEAQRARLAAHRTEQHRRHGAAQREIAAVWSDRAAELLDGRATDSEIRAAADRRAELMGELIAGLSGAMTTEAMREWLCSQVEAMQARPFPQFVRKRPDGQQLAGMLARAQCPLWWRRQLRRAVVRAAEAEAIRGQLVGHRAGQWYASDATVRRRLLQNARNARMLEATELENDLGEVFTLAALASKGTANKAVRRAELMTRIRGCEEWADAAGHVGLFLTLTAPSRFHAQRYQGGANPHYSGATPRDAQQWMCRTWARARAQLARLGVRLYGFRVAEPHHDACPHWHALLWVESERDRVLLQSVLWAQWLADGGDEAGAAEHRVKCERMRPGGAAGYVAKYIAKNIDDAGAVADEGHRDEWAAEQGGELQGELWANPHARVEAWAAAWGIRQFQAIGQPPVTVWRELRRVDAEAADMAPPRVQMAWDGVHRVPVEGGERRACWLTYLELQGGAGVGRDCPLRVAKLRQEFDGRYERIERALPVGVYTTDAPDVCVKSTRRKWRPRERVQGVKPGAALVERAGQGAKRAAPWTRFNNCTQGGGAADLLRALRAREPSNLKDAGGHFTEETEPWATANRPPTPMQPPRTPLPWPALA